MTAPPRVGDDVLIVFGVVHASAVGDELPDGVDVVVDGPIAAAVGTADAATGAATRLRRHDDVVNGFVARGITILPMRFGMAVADSDELVRNVLAPRRAEFDAALTRLAGYVQYTVRVGYVEAAVISAVLRDDSRIAALRDAARRQGAGQDLRIRLGQAVTEAIRRRRPRDIHRLAALLEPLAAQVVTQPANQPADRLCDYACLVSRADSDAFERELEGLAARHHDAVRMTLLGPLAPYDFVPEL